MTTARKHGSAAFHWRLDAHHRLVIALIVGALAFVVPSPAQLAARAVLSWDCFALAMIVLAWLVIATRDPYDVRRSVRLQDSSATFLFVVVISAATASLFAVGFLLGTTKDVHTSKLVGHVVASVAAVFLSWTLVHTIFALRYASAYFRDARKLERAQVAGGLDFPGKESPDYLDFVYFSFVIGMTCQVSDVQITDRRMRRLALVHGIISFAFNTAILAIFVNIVAGLI